MKYKAFQKIFGQYQVFSLLDIKKQNPNFQKIQLSRWASKGYLNRVVKGFYVFSDAKLGQHDLFQIANKIYSPSYISLEMALSFYNLIPEGAFLITSISSKKTVNFKTSVGSFSYQSIKKNLMFGYDIVRQGSATYKIAQPEKALLDYFYLNPHIETLEDFFELRINKMVFTELISNDKLLNYLDKINKKALTKRMNNFLKFIQND